MDASACRVVYIDDRFSTERWLSRDGLSSPMSAQKTGSTDLYDLPPDLQANVNAALSVFSQVYVCNSGRSFSTKLSEIHDSVKLDCTPIIALFDVGSESRPDHHLRSRHRFPTSAEFSQHSPSTLRRQITFSSESDESYGLQLLSRIASDLQVDEGVKLIIPVAIVQPKRRDSDAPSERNTSIPNTPHGGEFWSTEDQSSVIDSHMMLSCLEAGALDVVQSPLDKACIIGLTVHAYRIYKTAKKGQGGFLAQARGRRKQSWVGVEEEEEKPYSYMREAMVKKLLKGICEPETVIEDYQHRDLYVEDSRKEIIANEVGSWGFCAHDFTEDELVYAGYCMLNHALQLPALEQWRISQDELLRFMQGCRIAYNSFVLYHNFRHAVDVLQSLFYSIVQIGTLPPYPIGSEPPPFSNDKSPVAKLLQPFDALTLLVSAIGHDVGHPGVNNMFLVKLNAPLAQLYNDQSVLEAFHCAAYSQILRRHWPAAFNDKAIRKLMISSILATDMGVHSEYMQQLGQLQEKIHESTTTDGWSPKDVEMYRVLVCGLLIKCADISNVARPWAVAERWTHLLQLEFANQGKMESAVGMETVLFGGPPEIGNVLKLANSQIGFMTIFAHPLFQNVTDIIPAMGFAPAEILTNKGVWFTKAEQEKRKDLLKRDVEFGDGGAVSPRSQSPVGQGKRRLLGKQHPFEERDVTSYFPASPLKKLAEPSPPQSVRRRSYVGNTQYSQTGKEGHPTSSRRSSLGEPLTTSTLIGTSGNSPTSRRSSGAFSGGDTIVKPQTPQSNTLSSSQLQLGHDPAAARDTSRRRTTSENELPDRGNHPGVPQYDGTNDRESRVHRPNGLPFHEDVASGSSTRPDQSFSSATPPTSPFTFATSFPSEPTRTYDPSAHVQATSHPDRASVPATSNTNYDRMSMATSGAATTSEPDIGARTAISALSPSTEATSVVSGESDGGRNLGQAEAQCSPKDNQAEFESRRARAASAPTKAGFSFPHRGSRESSKQDIRTTVFGHETLNGGTATRGGTVPRKRSRLRLQFWKKRYDIDD